MRLTAIALMAAGALLAAPPNAAPAKASSTQAASSLQREVFGFALASSLSDPTVGYPSWDFSLLSTVAFFGLHINDDGTIASDSGLNVWNSSALTTLLSTAHAHGAKVVLTIIKQDFSAGTPGMCAALANRAIVVSQTAAQVAAKGVDGVNIDFEGLNGTCPNGQQAQGMMTDLAHQLRSALPAPLYLSVDTYASSATDSVGFFDVAGLNAYVDSFFVMAYDLEYSNYRRPPTSCSSFCLGPTSPLSGYYYNDTAVASEYVAAVGAGKVIFGVPYYGRKACVGGVGPNQYPTSSVVADSYLDASGEAAYFEVKPGTYVTNRESNSSGMERWDTWYNTTLGCTRELYWDDAVSLGLKYDLVNRDALRGVGIWNLNYGGGAIELWQALVTHFRRCISASLSPSPTSPQVAGTAVVFTASSTACVSPLYQFWTRPAASATWTMVQDYSGTNTFKLTSATAAGSYFVGVHVRDAASTAAYDSLAGIPYTLTSPACSAASISASPPASAPAGTSITVTAVGTCPNASPKYQFVALWAGTSTWITQQPYSTTSTWTWNSTGARSGVERFGVWVKDAASPNAYDQLASIPYAVTSQCSALSLSAAPPSPSASGTTITVTATATCPNANPQFKFVALWAGMDTWIDQKAYSTSNTWAWNSTGARSGVERFGVWVKDAASPSAYDQLASIPYTVTNQCTAVSVSAMPASPQAAGATITVTATSTCPNANPQYEFVALWAGTNTWIVQKAYSTSNTWTWNSTGAPPGIERFGVWVKDATSPNVYDKNASIPYTVS